MCFNKRNFQQKSEISISCRYNHKYAKNDKMVSESYA
jgi:hypothetical protein